jgi:hypothetical protein
MRRASVARSSWLVLACLLCFVLGCHREPASVELVKRLGDPDPQLRATAAQSLRALAARDPSAVGDKGEAFWKAKLATIPRGSTEGEVGMTLGPSQSGEGPWGGSHQTFGLDDYWRAGGSFKLDATSTYRLTGWDPPMRFVRKVDVWPGPGFSGKWLTYFVNGAVAAENDYASGTVTHIADYFDNGQPQSLTTFVGDKPEGPAVTYFRDGKKATEGRYAAGKRVGPWVEYYANGKRYVEMSYVDGEQDGIVIHWRADGTKESRMDFRLGKETGQAAWDERGTLVYARGSTDQDGGK